MGRFQPGQSGHPAGRPKGSRNKVGEIFRQSAIDFLIEDFPNLIKDLRSIKNPAIRLKFRIELAKLVVPSLKPVEISEQEKVCLQIVAQNQQQAEEIREILDKLDQME